MNQEIKDLIRDSAEWKPQRPSRGKYAKYIDLIQHMHNKGNTGVSIAAYLVHKKKITSDQEHSCRRSISSLLKRHAKTTPANTTSTP